MSLTPKDDERVKTLLEVYLRNHHNVTVSPPCPEASSESNKCFIDFDITSASCSQRVRLLDTQYSEDTIIAGLKDGSLITTTWHEIGDFSTIEVTETQTVIGIIESQEINGEYDEFR